MRHRLPLLIIGLVAWGTCLLFGLHAVLYASAYRSIQAGQRELMPRLYDLERLCYLDLALLTGCLALLCWLWRGRQVEKESKWRRATLRKR